MGTHRFIPQCYGLMHDPKETDCMGGEGKEPCIYQKDCGEALQRKTNMAKTTEWVTINKALLEDLLKVSESDPRTKVLVEKIREGMKRGAGKASTWIDPLPRSMEG